MLTNTSPRLLYSSSSSSSSKALSTVTDGDKFEVCLDVAGYAPDELAVKTLGNRRIVVEGKHEERRDENGSVYSMRQFARSYELPEDYRVEEVVSSLSSDGVLTVRVPKRPQRQAMEDGERLVPIEATGPMRQSIEERKAK